MEDTNHTTNTPESSWKDRAVAKYGSDLAEASAPLYGGRYEDMIKDDNVRGAIPTLPLNQACPWLKNKATYWFVCLLVELRYYREENELRLYLDARGERDLRNPGDSSVRRTQFKGDEGKPTTTPLSHSTTEEVITGEFVPEVSVPGHYKGYLSFDAGLFAKPGKYGFQFADPRRNASIRQMMAAMEARKLPTGFLFQDYPEIALFEVPESCESGRSGLERAFAKASVGGTLGYSTADSPFANDTDAIEQSRFAPLVDEAVWKRHEAPGGKHKWWVSLDDGGDTTPEPQRLLLSDPVGNRVMLNLK